MTHTWKVLLSGPASLGALLLAAAFGLGTTEAATAAQAQPETKSAVKVELAATTPATVSPAATTLPAATAQAPIKLAEATQPKAASAPTAAALEGVSQVAALQTEEDVTPMDQVTSVSQLTDVKPTDWAFQALQSLVERYGCIVGYPDKTFRGNRALTRYEFAAGLNACMDKVNELIASSTANLVKKEDLVALQKLQEEFAAELATLRGRVDALEARTATLEKQQFSTTTKLSGLVWFNVTGAFSGGDRNVRYEGLPGVPADLRFAGGRDATGRPLVQTTNRAETTFSTLTWLTLTTSFTGKDSLVTQLAAGNGISPYNQFASAGFFNATGTPFTDQTGGTVNGRNDVVIHDLFYSFPVGEKLQVAVGPRVNWYRYFDFNRFTFFLTGASSFNSIGSTLTNAIDRGSGAVVVWNINKQFRFAAAYLGENTEFLPSQFGYNTSSNPQFGLFGGNNTTSAELTYSPNDKINIRLGYNYSRLQAYGGQLGGALGEPLPYGYVDAGPGFSVNGGPGGLKYGTAHTLTFNFDWLITPKFGIFGRYGYGATTLNPIDKVVATQAFQVGLGFPDLGKKGALGTVTFLAPMDILAGRRYFASGGGNGGTEYNLEATYFYPVTDNIALVPAFYVIFSPNNFGNNPNVYVWNLRTQFSF